MNSRLARIAARPRLVVDRVKAALWRIEDSHARLERLGVGIDDLHRRLAEVERAALLARDAAQAATRASISTDPTRIRVVLLVHHTSAWSSFASVVRAMQEDARFEPYVVSIPKRFPGDLEFAGESEVHRFLKAQDVPHWRFDFEDSYRGLAILRALMPDLILRQSQWDADVQPGYSTENLAFTRLALIGYEMLNLIRNVRSTADVRDTAVDSAFHRACWRVFSASEMTMRQARRHSAARGHQYVRLGHPRLDALRCAEPRWPLASGDSTRPRVLWNAHHSINTGWNDFGMFPRIWRAMVGWAAASPEVDFVFSPHPALRTMLGSPLAETLAPEEVAEFWAAWDALPNTGSHLDGDYLPLFAAADLMVTDGISALLEFQLVNKPIVFIERPEHVAFNRVGRLVVKGVHRVRGVDAAREVAMPMLGGAPDPLEATQRASMQRLFGSSERVGVAIAEHIADAIAAESRSGR